MPGTQLTSVRTDRRVRRAGAWCLGGGLLGVAEVLVTLAWPPQVTADRFSYPFDAFWFVIAELSYVAQHVLLVAGGVALLWLPTVCASSAARIAIRVAVAGLALLAAVELSTLSLYNAAIDSSFTTVITSLFMLPTLLIGGGFTVAGVALLRHAATEGAGVGWLPAAVLAPGAYTFVVIVPAINGSDFVARLGIGGWMALFAALGYALTRPEGRGARRT